MIEERINGAAGIGLNVASAPANSGTIQLQPQKSSYVAGDVVTATAIPSAGYTFANWSGLPACTSASVCTFTMPGSSVSLTANFRTNSAGTYQLRTLAAPNGGGAVTAPNPAGYAAGSTVSLTATPAAGYVVDYWYGAACTNYSGTTCTFSMPAQNADVFVRFKPSGGTGYPLTTYAALYTGMVGNPLAAGMLDVSPGAGNIPAGTPVTLTVRTATGYLFGMLDIKNSAGVSRNELCPSITLYSFMPGAVPTCTFAMPAEALDITTYFEVFPEHFALDLGVTPAQSGSVQVVTTDAPNSLEHYLDTSVTPYRRMVQGGLQTTLTAKPMGSRRFVRWANGPCANSTNPVCSFVMPMANTLSNPVFSDETPTSCTYSVTRSGTGVFRATGGSMVLNVATQAGCNFNADLTQHYASRGTLSVGSSSVTLNLPSKVETYPTAGQVSLFLGRELMVVPFLQLAASDVGVTDLPAVAFTDSTAYTGVLPPPSKTITITNNTAQAQALRKPQTIGPFALQSSTCPGSLAAGASCTISLQFIPMKPGASVGEFQMTGTTTGWRAALSGTGVLSRENVAAAAAGGLVEASSRLDDFAYSEQALINGDRSGEPLNAQGLWVANAPTQSVVIRFAGQKKVDRVDLIGYDSGVAPFMSESPQGEPSPDVDKPANSINIQSFSVEYWDGVAWQPVAETARVDAPKRWLQVGFTPVQTDQVRLTVTGALGHIRASEVMVWTPLADTAPNAFSFATQNDVPQNTVIRSNAITPTGFTVPVSVSVLSGSYSIGCTGTFVTTAGVISPGQSVCVSHTSAPAGGSRLTRLTIGGVSATFTSYSATTNGLPVDTTPDPISAQSINDVQKGVVVNFLPVTLSGINAQIVVSSVGGQFSVGCTGAYTASGGASVVQAPGTTICVRHTSANADGASTVTVLTLNNVNVSFTSTTKGVLLPTLTVTPTVVAGWNLLGNGINQSIAVGTELADNNVIASVWKWDAAADRWMFYAPSLDAASLATYAATKGYGVLTEILPGEGYWLNAKLQTTLPARTGQAVNLSPKVVPQGWNLVAVGTNPTPAAFASEGVFATPSGLANSVVSLWAWSPEKQKWFLFVPNVDNRAVFQEFLNSRGYLDFLSTDRTLTPGTGFWVNRQ